MSNTPSSQIVSDIIMQSSIKNLERLVLSKHDAFVSSISVYEEMLQRLDRTLKLHENFMASKQEAFDSSLKNYALALDLLKIEFFSFESHNGILHAQFGETIAIQQEKIKTFEALMTKGAKIVCWVLGMNAVLTLSLLIRWFFK